MNLSSKTYYAKLLLFGEYTVTLGGSAIALPLSSFSGTWSFTEYSKEYAEKMIEFAGYAAQQSYSEFPPDNYNAAVRQINEGLRFISDIPSGYGLGSSGTFVAAFYDRFFQQSKKLILPELKTQLASLESYFHGKSSGIDPLVSFLNTAILIKRDKISLTDVNLQKLYPFHFFLVDTGIERSTSHWVDIFYNKLNNITDFGKAVKSLEKINNETIGAFIQQDYKIVVSNFTRISNIQYTEFTEFIPEGYRKTWKKGLECGTYHLKLCGAGGGGMLLGLTDDKNSVKENFHEEKIIFI